MTRYSKLIAALVGAVLVAVSQGLIAGTAAKVVAVVVAFLTAAGVYQARNDDDSGASTVEVCLILLVIVALAWAAGLVPR